MRRFAIMTIFFILVAGITTIAWGQSATTDEVIQKCSAAANMIRDDGIKQAITEIGKKDGKFVWKDTYVFLMDMDGKMLAHPIKPQLTERDTLLQVKDTQGKPLFVDFVRVANSKKGAGWVDYMWPKPGQDTPAQKSSYILRVDGTQYFVGAGIYK